MMRNHLFKWMSVCFVAFVLTGDAYVADTGNWDGGWDYLDNENAIAYPESETPVQVDTTCLNGVNHYGSPCSCLLIEPAGPNPPNEPIVCEHPFGNDNDFLLTFSNSFNDVMSFSEDIPPTSRGHSCDCPKCGEGHFTCGHPGCPHSICTRCGTCAQSGTNPLHALCELSKKGCGGCSAKHNNHVESYGCGAPYCVNPDSHFDLAACDKAGHLKCRNLNCVTHECEKHWKCTDDGLHSGPLPCGDHHMCDAAPGQSLDHVNKAPCGKHFICKSTPPCHTKDMLPPCKWNHYACSCACVVCTVCGRSLWDSEALGQHHFLYHLNGGSVTPGGLFSGR